jgi:hypothetical protein
MKRALLLVPALAMLFSIGCAVRGSYYSRPYYQYRDRDHYRERDHRYRYSDHDRDDYRRDRWR